MPLAPTVDAGMMRPMSRTFICFNCGHAVEGDEAPLTCPRCYRPAGEAYVSRKERARSTDVGGDPEDDGTQELQSGDIEVDEVIRKRKTKATIEIETADLTSGQKAPPPLPLSRQIDLHEVEAAKEREEAEKAKAKRAARRRPLSTQTETLVHLREVRQRREKRKQLLGVVVLLALAGLAYYFLQAPDKSPALAGSEQDSGARTVRDLARVEIDASAPTKPDLKPDLTSVAKDASVDRTKKPVAKAPLTKKAVSSTKAAAKKPPVKRPVAKKPVAKPETKTKARPPVSKKPAASAEVRALYQQGIQQLMLGKPGNAITIFNSVVAKNRRYALAYRGMGLAYEKQGRKSLAIASYRQYLAMRPKAKDKATIQKRISRLQGR
jgi:tetratricopeptide (TPR) repeat protein